MVFSLDHCKLSDTRIENAISSRDSHIMRGLCESQRCERNECFDRSLNQSTEPFALYESRDEIAFSIRVSLN